MPRADRHRLAGRAAIAVPFAAAACVVALMIGLGGHAARPAGVGQRAATLARRAPVDRPPPRAVVSATAHYRVHSTASASTTRAVADAVEALYDAYVDRFPMHGGRRFELVLYRDRAQFRAYQQRTGWAEAMYRTPYCHAYAAAPPNRYHWMLHEATHQLLREGSGYRPPRRANEGLAAHFRCEPHRRRPLAARDRVPERVSDLLARADAVERGPAS